MRVRESLHAAKTCRCRVCAASSCRKGPPSCSCSACRSICPDPARRRAAAVTLGSKESAPVCRHEKPLTLWSSGPNGSLSTVWSRYVSCFALKRRQRPRAPPRSASGFPAAAPCRPCPCGLEQFGCEEPIGSTTGLLCTPESAAASPQSGPRSWRFGGS